MWVCVYDLSDMVERVFCNACVCILNGSWCTTTGSLLLTCSDTFIRHRTILASTFAFTYYTRADTHTHTHTHTFDPTAASVYLTLTALFHNALERKEETRKRMCDDLNIQQTPYTLKAVTTAAKQMQYNLLLAGFCCWLHRYTTVRLACQCQCH